MRADVCEFSFSCGYEFCCVKELLHATCVAPVILEERVAHLGRYHGLIILIHRGHDIIYLQIGQPGILQIEPLVMDLKISSEAESASFSAVIAPPGHKRHSDLLVPWLHIPELLRLRMHQPLFFQILTIRHLRPFLQNHFFINIHEGFMQRQENLPYVPIKSELFGLLCLKNTLVVSELELGIVLGQLL